MMFQWLKRKIPHTLTRLIFPFLLSLSQANFQNVEIAVCKCFHELCQALITPDFRPDCSKNCGNPNKKLLPVRPKTPRRKRKTVKQKKDCCRAFCITGKRSNTNIDKLKHNEQNAGNRIQSKTAYKSGKYEIKISQLYIIQSNLVTN